MTDDPYQEIERTGGAGLPHRDADPVMRLYAHYFEPADLMLHNVERLDRAAAKGSGLSPARVAERRTYLMYWLSGLYVTIEGIESLPLIDELKRRPSDMSIICHRVNEILADADDYRDSLRILRNATFHYQETADKHVQFFENLYGLSWAKHLHRGIDRVFSDYRVECMVICMFAGRKDEIELKRKPHPARRTRILG